MAISATNLTTTGSGTDAASYTTDTVSPGSNRLVLLWVYSIAASAPNVPTVSGNGLTWQQIDSQIDTNNLRRGTLFRAMGASPSSGIVTIDFGGQTQAGAAWSVAEFDGVDTSGSNGSGAIVQSAKTASVGTSTSLTVTLSAFSSVSNATFGAFGIPLNTAGLPDPGSGFTELGQRNQSSPNLAIVTEWLNGTDTTVDSTSAAASVPWVGIAVEIKLAPVVVSPATAALTVSAFAPSMSVTDNKTVVPGALSTGLTRYALSALMTANVAVIPGSVATTVAQNAPTVYVTNNVAVEPGTNSVVTDRYSPAVLVTENQFVVPGSGIVAINAYPPSVAVSDHKVVAPGAGSMILTTYAPTTIASSNQTVAVGVSALAVTLYTPVVTVTNHLVVSPGNAELVSALYQSTVAVTANVVVVPDFSSLAAVSQTPTFDTTDHKLIIPGSLALEISPLVPVVITVSDSEREVATVLNALARTSVVRRETASSVLTNFDRVTILKARRK